MTQIFRLDPRDVYPGQLARPAQMLRDGQLVAFPTETVYGLGTCALNAAAVAHLFAAKQRPAEDPLIVHLVGLERLDAVVSRVPAEVAALAAAFWPGPLTLVLPRSSRVPRIVTAGLDTVAIRVPAHPVARALLDLAGVPVAAPSANLFSRPSPTTAADVLEDLDGRIDAVVDGGETDLGVESTVLDLTTPVPRLLRPGGISIEQLRGVLPAIHSEEVGTAAQGPAPSPGLLETHYSPRTPLTLYTGSRADALARLQDDLRTTVARGQRVGLLVADDDAIDTAKATTVRPSIGATTDLPTRAKRLYTGMRELDRAGVDVILARDIDGREGLAPALRDRLRRAAGGRIIAC